jgi:hypothetical protein
MNPPTRMYGVSIRHLHIRKHRCGSINMDRSDSVKWSLTQCPSWPDLSYVIWRREWSKPTTPPVPYGWDKADCMRAVWHSTGGWKRSQILYHPPILSTGGNNWYSCIYTSALGSFKEDIDLKNTSYSTVDNIMVSRIQRKSKRLLCKVYIHCRRPM